MALTLEIDGFDFTPYLRINPEDGYQPVDNDMLEPQFGESPNSSGDPLNSIHEGNQERAWPVHLTPSKSGGAYASTKDGFHQLVARINRVCASARQVRWREDGATDYSYADVVFARFEPAYNARKAQNLWLSGTLRIFTRTYAHTGTYRIGATGATGALAVAIALGSLPGDAPADLDVNVHASVAVGAYNIDAPVAGYAIVPSGYPYFIPGASIPGGATRLTSQPVPGGIMERFPFAAAATSGAFNEALATLPVGALAGRRHRAFLFTRFSRVANSASIILYGRMQQVLGRPGPTAVTPVATWTTAAGAGGSFAFYMLDLGAFSVPSSPLASWLGMKINLGVFNGGAGAAAATHYAEIGGILVLPEGQTGLVAQPTALRQHAPSMISPSMSMRTEGPEARSTIDGGLTPGFSPQTLNVAGDIRGLFPRATPAQAGLQLIAFAFRPGATGLTHTTSADVRVRENFTYAR